MVELLSLGLAQGENSSFGRFSLSLPLLGICSLLLGNLVRVCQMYTIWRRKYSYIFLARLVLAARLICCYFSLPKAGGICITSSFVFFFFNNKRSSLFNHGESFALRGLHCTACLLTAERKWSFNLDRVLRVKSHESFGNKSQIPVGGIKSLFESLPTSLWSCKQRVTFRF